MQPIHHRMIHQASSRPLFGDNNQTLVLVLLDDVCSKNYAVIWKVAQKDVFMLFHGTVITSTADRSNDDELLNKSESF